MGSAMKFKHQLELRNGESDFDSPSDESKSSWSSEPASKKHKLVSGLISLEEEDDEIKWNQRTRKRDSNGKVSGENSSETGAGEFDALDNLKLFVESLLQDLEAKRENLFAWMKHELQKLVAVDAIERLQQRRNVQPRNRDRFEENNRAHCQKTVEQNILVQHPNGFKENFRIQNETNEESGLENCYQTLEGLDHFLKSSGKLISAGKSRGEKLDLHVKRNTPSSPSDHKSFVSNRTSVFRNGFIEGKTTPYPNSNAMLNHNVGYDRGFASRTSSRKEKEENLGLYVEPNIAACPSNETPSSMYLMQPAVLTRPPFLENRRLDILSGNYIPPVVSGNTTSMNFDVANHRYFLDKQQEERNRDFARLSSENLASVVQRNNPASLIGNRFPFSLHQCTESPDTSFRNLRNQFVFANQTPGRNNISGLSTDGRAITLSEGRNFGLSSQHYVANNLISYSNGKTDVSRLNSFPNPRP